MDKGCKLTFHRTIIEFYSDFILNCLGETLLTFHINVKFCHVKWFNILAIYNIFETILEIVKTIPK